MHTRMHIYKQRLLSVRHFFHVKLPGSTFPFPSLPPPRAHWYESFPAFYIFFFLFCVWCKFLQLTRFVRLWLCQISQFQDVLQLIMVLLLYFFFSLSNRSGRCWKGDICLKSITCNYVTPPNKSGSLLPVGRVDIPNDKSWCVLWQALCWFFSCPLLLC